MTTLAPAAVAAQCRGTPTVQVVDNRGLAVRTLQYNRSAAGTPADELITRQGYTARGHLRSQLDPRLAAAKALDPTVPPNFRYDRSLSGRALRSQSQDAGSVVQLFDVEGGPVWQTDSRAQRMDWTYDALHRLVAMREQAADAPARISERYTYADGDAVAAAANCRGRLVAHHDTAGRNETP
ncbi:RHS repeat protein, partial [Pseudomonas resinovorans]|nr:RHS repeat protein [Pseudomonas resinovorans]